MKNESDRFLDTRKYGAKAFAESALDSVAIDCTRGYFFRYDASRFYAGYLRQRGNCERKEGSVYAYGSNSR